MLWVVWGGYLGLIWMIGVVLLLCCMVLILLMFILILFVFIVGIVKLNLFVFGLVVFGLIGFILGGCCGGGGGGGGICWCVCVWLFGFCIIILIIGVLGILFVGCVEFLISLVINMKRVNVILVFSNIDIIICNILIFCCYWDLVNVSGFNLVYNFNY